VGGGAIILVFNVGSLTYTEMLIMIKSIQNVVKSVWYGIIDEDIFFFPLLVLLTGWLAGGAGALLHYIFG
jgi:hypothetical protein